MVHIHNSAEHTRIYQTAASLQEKIDEMWIHHANGNEELNKRIKVMQNTVSKLVAQLDAHVENTQNVDDIYKKYQSFYNMGTKAAWVVASSVLAGITGWLLRHYGIF